MFIIEVVEVGGGVLECIILKSIPNISPTSCVLMRLLGVFIIKSVYNLILLINMELLYGDEALGRSFNLEILSKSSMLLLHHTSFTSLSQAALLKLIQNSAAKLLTRK